MPEAHINDRIEVAAHARNLVLVREFLHGAIRRSHLPPECANKVVLAVDEAVANTIEHGYVGREGGKVEVRVDADNRQFKITIRDNGVAYDPASSSTDKLSLDLQKHIESGSRQGLGLFIMRRVMDEVSYRSIGGEVNELTMVKYIAGQEGQPQ
jgi:serine/threonine-protein kinase RsbW